MLSNSRYGYSTMIFRDLRYEAATSSAKKFSSHTVSNVLAKACDSSAAAPLRQV